MSKTRKAGRIVQSYQSILTSPLWNLIALERIHIGRRFKNNTERLEKLVNLD